MGVWHRYKEAVYVPDESGMCVVVRVWRRSGKAASASLSAALYSVHHGLYSEAVVSSVASAVALVGMGRFREAVKYVQKAAKALYEAAKEVFEQVEVTVQRLVELFVEAVTRVLACIDEHKAYLFLMAAVALSAALNMWGLVELEKLTHFAMGVPFFHGLTDTGGRAAERFKTLAERYEGWRVDERLIDGVLKTPLRRESPYKALLKLAESPNLPKPLAELRRALMHVEGEVVQDAAVVAALVLYKTLVKNAEAYGKWAELYKWARSLVGRQAFTVAAGDIKRLHEAHNGLVGVAGRVLEELNTVLTLYSKSGFYKEADLKKLKSLLEVDLKRAEGLAEANYTRLSDYSDVSMGTKAYAALLSIARGGLYGHAAMLLMGEGALADIVISTPMGTYKKAERIAKGRSEAVDPSRLPKGAAGRWEDRAASALLHYLLGSAVNEDLKFRHIGEGFEVFKAYGGVEAHIDTLKIGETARSKVAGEELRRFVDEARRMTPDLSGIKKIWQTLEWLNTDMSFLRGWIVAATAQPWQLAWYIALFGEGKIGRGGANVTRKGGRPNVTMYWPREVLDRIIAEEGKELKPLLCRPVKSWRELVDSIGWSQVLERVEELAGALKPWIGRKEAKDAEREGLVRRMLGELALLVHFAEARKVKDDDKWRKERAVRLSRAVEALSGGRIRGDYADRLAKLIISYAEGYKKKAEERIENLADELSGVSREEVWGLVDFALNDMRCLAKDCARDKVVRKFVAPALELIMLDKALNNEFDREETLLIFGEMYATAIAGDGTVGPSMVKLTVGGELGGGTALLRLAMLHLLNQLLPKELTFNVRIYVERGRNYNIVATGGDAARFKRFLTVAAPSAGGGHLSPKFEDFVEAARVEVRLDKDSIRPTKSGRVAAYLTLSEAGIAVKYNVYLRNKIKLRFQSTNRGRAELAARLLRLAGVSAEVKREGGRGMWQVWATTDKLAAGHEELRRALVEIVRRAVESGWVNAGKTERWLDKLRGGHTLKEEWPKYEVGLVEGALRVRFSSTNPESIVRETQQLENMGLVEGRHFTVKMPEDGGKGYVSILREGLAYAAWLSLHGSGDQKRLATEFVEYILQRAGEEGQDVYRKAVAVVEEGKARGSLRLEGFEGVAEVGGREHVVKVIGGGAELEEGKGGKKLLRIRATAEVDGVKSDYEMTFRRRGADNAAVGFAVARADAPGGREADAERFAAVIKALTGREPRVYRRSDGRIDIMCGREHLDGFARYAELADAIRRWLEETGR